MLEVRISAEIRWNDMVIWKEIIKQYQKPTQTQLYLTLPFLTCSLAEWYFIMTTECTLNWTK